MELFAIDAEKALQIALAEVEFRGNGGDSRAGTRVFRRLLVPCRRSETDRGIGAGTRGAGDSSRARPGQRVYSETDFSKTERTMRNLRQTIGKQMPH
jgi:hypothetical protein